MPKIPVKTVERLSLYRRLLLEPQVQEKESIFSHELASMCNVTPAQVRRDLMLLEQSGNPRKGYTVSQLAGDISAILDPKGGVKLCLIGVGNLGRAILTYFMGRRPNLSIVAAFDRDETKVGRVIAGCRCYTMSELSNVVKSEGIEVGVLTVPGNEVQKVADELVGQGVKGIVNFAPVPLRVPMDVFVEKIDITIAFEKTAFFARAMRKGT
jgi:redox-sensing transcriptional repressor